MAIKPIDYILNRTDRKRINIMANRWFNQFKGSLDKGVVMMDGYVSIDDDASVVSQSLLGATVTRTGTGTYLVQFEDNYPKGLSCSVELHSIGTAALACKVKQWLTEAGVDAGADLANVKAVVIQTVTPATGAPVDAVVKCGISLNIVLKNSGV